LDDAATRARSSVVYELSLHRWLIASPADDTARWSALINTAGFHYRLLTVFGSPFHRVRGAGDRLFNFSSRGFWALRRAPPRSVSTTSASCLAWRVASRFTSLFALAASANPPSIVSASSAARHRSALQHGREQLLALITNMLLEILFQLRELGVKASSSLVPFPLASSDAVPCCPSAFRSQAPWYRLPCVAAGPDAALEARHKGSVAR
jgi:hypothetical protein